MRRMAEISELLLISPRFSLSFLISPSHSLSSPLSIIFSFLFILVINMGYNYKPKLTLKSKDKNNDKYPYKSALKRIDVYVWRNDTYIVHTDFTLLWKCWPCFSQTFPRDLRKRMKSSHVLCYQLLIYRAEFSLFLSEERNIDLKLFTRGNQGVLLASSSLASRTKAPASCSPIQ